MAIAHDTPDCRTAVIVEGYMDAIAAHEYGFTNVVASMGTALTENQVSQLRSLAHELRARARPGRRRTGGDAAKS